VRVQELIQFFKKNQRKQQKVLLVICVITFC